MSLSHVKKGGGGSSIGGLCLGWSAYKWLRIIIIIIKKNMYYKTFLIHLFSRTQVAASIIIFFLWYILTRLISRHALPRSMNPTMRSKQITSELQVPESLLILLPKLRIWKFLIPTVEVFSFTFFFFFFFCEDLQISLMHVPLL